MRVCVRVTPGGFVQRQKAHRTVEHRRAVRVDLERAIEPVGKRAAGQGSVSTGDENRFRSTELCGGSVVFRSSSSCTHWHAAQQQSQHI